MIVIHSLINFDSFTETKHVAIGSVNLDLLLDETITILFRQ